MVILIRFNSHAANRDLRSFPTRRSSDLLEEFRNDHVHDQGDDQEIDRGTQNVADLERIVPLTKGNAELPPGASWKDERHRSEEHTSELQSHVNLVCRLLLEKKNI